MCALASCSLAPQNPSLLHNRSQNFISTLLRRREIPLAEKWRSGKQSWLITGQAGTSFVRVSSLVLRGIRLVLTTCFSPQSRCGGSFDLFVVKGILRAKDKLDRVYSSCGRKMKTLPQLYSFVSSALFSSENEKSESEERFKRPVQALPSNVGFFARLNSTGQKKSETCTWQCSCVAWLWRRARERVGSNWSTS